MHKIRKLFLSLLLFPLALISCGNNRVYGHYAFQMGSDKSTHFGVYIDLTQDAYPPEEEGEESPGPTFKIGMKVSDDIMPLEPWEDPEPTVEKTFLWFFLDSMVSGLQGYYSIGNKNYEELGKRLYLTLMMEELPIPLPLPEELAEQFIVAYIEKKEIKLIMPVSLKDIQCQLCWYGVFLQVYTFDVGDTTDMGVYYKFLYDDPRWVNNLHYPTGDDLKERVGTHPTPDDIEDMNEVFGTNTYGDDIFHQTINPTFHPEIDVEISYNFHDYNALTIELLKE